MTAGSAATERRTGPGRNYVKQPDRRRHATTRDALEERFAKEGAARDDAWGAYIDAVGVRDLWHSMTLEQKSALINLINAAKVVRATNA